MGDTNLIQINELTEEQTNKKPWAKKQKQRGVEIQLTSLKKKQVPAAT